MRIAVSLPIIVLLLLSCGSQESATPTSVNPTVTAMPPTSTVVTEATPVLRPTAAPTPAQTPTPPPTPAPTPTFSPGRVILPTVAVPTPTPTSAATLEQTLDASGLLTSMLRELSHSGPMDREFITREALETRLREDFAEQRDAIYQEQELYIALGILDEGTDFEELLLGLYSEGVVGFFDPEENTMYVVEDASGFGPDDELTFAHEYTHGLQQKHFDIQALGEAVEDDTDMSLALSAFIEGDATLTESFYYFQHLTQEEQQQIAEESQSTSVEAFRSAPHVVQRTFAFPYLEGAQFAFSLFVEAEGWDLINQTYSNYPRSTEQILHPERYAEGDEPISVNIVNVAEPLGDEWTQLGQDTFGELRLVSFLETGLAINEAVQAAEGWGGDRYSLLKGPDDESLVVWLTVWDSQADAEEFYEGFSKFMSQRTGLEWETNQEDGTERRIDLPEQSVFLRLDGTDTLIIYTPDSTSLEAVLSALLTP